MKVILSFLLVLAFLYILLVAFAYLKQSSMLFYPTREIDRTPKDIGLAFEEITLRARDGVNLSAWYIPAHDERGVVLFCHGNAGNISHRLDSIRIFHELRLGVLIFDYRGYGKSDGSPTEKGTYLDAGAAWDYLVTARRVPPKEIVLFGRSLGGAIAADIALTHHAGALIIESGFTSVPDLGCKYFPYLPVRLISRFQYSSADKVGKITIPKLFIHSPQDEIIPFVQGLALFEKAAEPKEFLQIRGGHNEGFLLTGEAYVQGLDRFLSKWL